MDRSNHIIWLFKVSSVLCHTTSLKVILTSVTLKLIFKLNLGRQLYYRTNFSKVKTETKNLFNIKAISLLLSTNSPFL